MTVHLSWLQGPEDKPDPHEGDRSASAVAAENAENERWGHLYWANRQQPKPETVTPSGAPDSISRPRLTGATPY